MNYPHNHDTVEAIITLNHLNWSYNKISRAMGINRKKIAKILETSKNLKRPNQDSLICNNNSNLKPAEGSRECLNCKEFFIPDQRHMKRQKYCNKEECKAASKRNSQRKWTEKNPDYWV